MRHERNGLGLDQSTHLYSSTMATKLPDHFNLTLYWLKRKYSIWNKWIINSSTLHGNNLSLVISLFYAWISKCVRWNNKPIHNGKESPKKEGLHLIPPTPICFQNLQYYQTKVGSCQRRRSRQILSAVEVHFCQETNVFSVWILFSPSNPSKNLKEFISREDKIKNSEKMK